MPDPAVFKIAEVQKLDEFFSGTPEVLTDAYEYSLELLNQYDDQPLSEIIAHIERANESQVGGRRLPRDVGSALHFHEHWLSEMSVFAGKNVEVFRDGYRTAIELATSGDAPLPIDTVWVSGVTEDFEIHSAAGPRQISVVVFVPLSEEEFRTTILDAK